MDKRLIEERLKVSPDSADVDHLVQCLSNLRKRAREGEMVKEQVIKVGTSATFLLLRSMYAFTPRPRQKKQGRVSVNRALVGRCKPCLSEVRFDFLLEVSKLLLELTLGTPSKAQDVMLGVCSALADLGVEEPAFSKMLQNGVRLLAKMLSTMGGREWKSWVGDSHTPEWLCEPCLRNSTSSDEMVELLYSLAALHGGKMPFNLLPYAWILAIHCAVPGQRVKLLSRICPNIDFIRFHTHPSFKSW